jgi:PAS domain S-box-containing protein
MTVAVSFGIIWYAYRMESLVTTVIQPSLAAVEVAGELQTALTNQRHYVSDSLLEGRRDWQKELEMCRQNFNERLKEARGIDRSETSRRILDRIESEYRQYNNSEDKVLEFYKAGELEVGARLYRDTEEQFFTILSLCKEYKDTHEQTLNLAWSNIYAHGGRLRQIALIGVVAVVVAGTLALLIFILQVLRPLHRLVTETEQASGSVVGPRNEVSALKEGVHGLIDDIGQTKRALKESENSYHGIFESTSDLLFLIDLDGRILDVNPASCSACGFLREELLGKTMYEIVDPEHLDLFHAATEKLAEGKAFLSKSARMRKKGGGSFPVEIRFAPLLREGRAVVLAAARDITNPMLTDEALRERAKYLEERVKELNCIFGISALTSRPGISLDEIIKGTVNLISSSLGYPDVACARATVEEKEYRSDNFKDSTWKQTSKISVQGRQVGSLEVCFLEERSEAEDGYSFSVEKNMIDLIADRLGGIIERRRSVEQIRVLTAKLMEVQETERKLIARDIHDSIGSGLAGLKYRLERALHDMGDAHTPQRKLLEKAISATEDAIDETRRISTNLRPTVLDDLGLLAAITWFCREFQETYSGIRLDQQIAIQEYEVPNQLKIVIFRILQEALNNVSKHSRANLVRLSLEKRMGRIELTIEDNGQGFIQKEVLSEQSTVSGTGVMSMRERTELFGGAFHLRSAKGEGTSVQVSWPQE